MQRPMPFGNGAGAGRRAQKGVVPFVAVSLTQVQSFIAVAEEGHVGRAARRLHLTQPPLSRHILSLEEELGARLFERTPRGMRLLPAGEVFLAHARRILAEVDAATTAIRSLSPTGRGPG